MIATLLINCYFLEKYIRYNSQKVFGFDNSFIISFTRDMATAQSILSFINPHIASYSRLNMKNKMVDIIRRAIEARDKGTGTLSQFNLLGGSLTNLSK